MKELFQTASKKHSIIGLGKKPKSETSEVSFFLSFFFHYFFYRWQFVGQRGNPSYLGVQFEGSNDVGVFSKLTNKYCLVATGGSENFYSAFETELADQIPVIKTSIAGCRFVGRVTAGTCALCLLGLGNKNGLLVPISTTDVELEQICNSIPDGVVVKRVDDRLSSLGNLIACNDHVALLHSDLGRVSLRFVFNSPGNRRNHSGCSRCGSVPSVNRWKRFDWQLLRDFK